jgi:radical SAM superfamily enzyme YgiQ (UPF0313 family)
MRVLLVKPSPRDLEFGLAPFFQTEPLGLQYVAAALARHGHQVRVLDLRFERRPLARWIRDVQPDVVGISCVHILEADAVAGIAEAVRALQPGVRVIVGGHAASMYPRAFAAQGAIDAIVTGEGEAAMPAVCTALTDGRGLESVPGILLPDRLGEFSPTSPPPQPLDLTTLSIPDRSAVARYQRHYCCLNYMPVWTVETARGCEHRCSFCSVWQFHRRSLRFHAIEAVRADFASAGPNVFIVDDTFWTGRDRSWALAGALSAGATGKNWLLAQARLDTVVEHPELLEKWRPLARNFDVFFGFEAPTTEGLDALNKDVDVARTGEALAVARKLGFGVTGNFIIDPAYTEDDFRALWSFLQQHQLSRVGFTILTPLPGTRYFEQMRDRLAVLEWGQFDLHHLLWQPRLPVRRFFELYCETWRRSVLYLQGQKPWWKWIPNLRIRDAPRLARILRRTQRLMDPEVYLSQCALNDPMQAGAADGATSPQSLESAESSRAE